jgi:outer membrane protein assembly factor BamB
MASASEPPDSPLAGTVDDLARAYEAGGDELVGHQKAEDVLVGADGITVLGTVSVAGGRELTVVRRLNPDGELEWERVHESGAGRALAALPDGGFVVAGEVQNGPVEFHGHLMRLRADGELEAERTVGEAGGLTSVAVLADGSTLAGGTERRQGWLVGGDREQTLEDTAVVVAVAPLEGGGFAIAATADPSTTTLGMTRIATYDADRAERWTARLPARGRGEPAAIAELAGGVIAVGHVAPDGDGAAMLWVLRLGADGDVEWERTLEASGETRRAHAVALLPGGDLVVAGDAATDAGRALRLARLTPDGDTVWEQAPGDGDEDTAHGLAATDDGGLVLVGSTGSAPTKAAVWRLDGGGGVPWSRTFG